MITPATYNFKIVRGTAGPRVGFRFRLRTIVDPDPLTYGNVPYQDVRLNVKKGNKLLFVVSVANGRLEETDALTNEFLWAPTQEESRSIPVGAVASYEVEVWNGATIEEVFLMGTITGLGGVNDDQ